MIVATTVVAFGETVESIQVELPLKACQLGLAKVVGHDVLSKILGFVNNEAASMVLPGHKVRKSVRFHLN